MAAEDYFDMTYIADEEEDIDGPKGPPCPDHGNTAELLDDSVIYGKSFGRVWKCMVLGCDYRVGAHPDGNPKGIMANESMRQARKAAHASFDAWWKSAGLTRSQAYYQLKKQTGVQHIAEATIEECTLIWKTFYPPMLKFIKT